MLSQPDPQNQKEIAREARRLVGPLTEKLLQERLKATRTTLLLDRFCRLLREAGVPLDRATLSIQQLHPLLRARTVVWDRASGGAVETGRAHGIQNSANYLASPFAIVHSGQGPVRRRLLDPDSPVDFPVLEELKSRGYRDYILRSMPFANGLANALGCATRAEDGFSDLHLATIDAAVPACAAALELRHLLTTGRQLLETYLGPNSGRQVYGGTVQRGDGEVIHAVLWYCDLRDFTGLSGRLPLEAVIALLNDYFDCMAKPVQARGGEILKFIGDAMLAIFPCDPTPEDQAKAAEQACIAAEEALAGLKSVNAARVAANLPALRCGIALHGGDVMYGNIGSESRLDFTVIGPAVNLVARLEDLTKDLPQPVVLSSTLQAILKRDLRSLGFHRLKGVPEEEEAFTFKC